MALTDDIVLKYKQIVLTQNAGSVVSIDLDNSPFLFGTVEVVNDLTDTYAVGDNVLFDSSNATKFRQGSIDYYLTTEDKVSFNEIAPFLP